MAQQNERVFFDDGQYLVTDLRFVRKDDGITHPMSTIERIYQGQDEEYVGPGCLAPFFYYTLFVVGMASCVIGGVIGLDAYWLQEWARAMFFSSSV